MKELLVILPASTAYRAPFFDSAIAKLAEGDIRTVVAHGHKVRAFEARTDVVESSWSAEVPTHAGPGPLRGLEYRRWRRASGSPDFVIVQQAVKNLETYPLLARKSLGGPSVAMWGHGRSYSTPQGPAIAAAKQFLTRRCDWFFAYTRSGADHVISHGFPRTRVSVLNNTIDTDALQADLSGVANDDVAAFQRRHGLTRGLTALFLGGVDKPKGIDFLLESALQAERLLPGFVLLVGGAGQDLPKVQAAEAAGAPVRALGRLDGTEKALALRAADLLAIPEWIGLVAVDSLVAGRPIVSTWHSSHSPEREYLVPDTTAVFVDHEVGAYARALTDLLDSGERLAGLQTRCAQDSINYGLDHMVDAFVEGVLAWDDVRRAGP